MAKNDNKQYRGKFNDLLYSTKTDKRAEKFEIFFSRDRNKLCYKNSDYEIVELEDGDTIQGVVSVTGSAVDNTDPKNPIINIPSGGDYIPLSGTVSGSPVTGNIEIYDGFQMGAETTGFIYNSDGTSLIHVDVLNDRAYSHNVSSDPVNPTVTINRTEFSSGSIIQQIYINSQGKISVDDNEFNKGLVGERDYSENYDDLTYTQKIYVIPRTGTEAGKEVTGIIEFKGDPSKTCLSTLNDQIVIGAGNDLNIDENATIKAFLDLTSSGDELNSAKIVAQDSTNGLIAMLEAKTDTSQLSAYQQFININVGGESAGLGATNDHTPFIGDLDYVQKKYVDIPILNVDYGDIIAVASKAQIITTGIGTGTARVDLLPTIAIGDLIFVSDLANNASTYNIQIDAGAGNTILKGDGTPATQTFTIDSSGQSYTLRKMTATQFMIIGTNQ